MSLAALTLAGFDVETTNHAKAILTSDFPEPLDELCQTLLEFRIDCLEMLKGGGGEAPQTQRLRRALANRRWLKRNVTVSKIIDSEEHSSMTHEIDHIRIHENGWVALEIEWNNKDPFFDRDLENFQRLHADGAISVGVIVTRGKSLQASIPDILTECAKAHRIDGFDDLPTHDISITAKQRTAVERRYENDFASAWARTMSASKYGSATTHWTKLQDRLARGVGNPCPLMLIGIPASVVTHSHA